jgi:hypothetical protein
MPGFPSRFVGFSTHAQSQRKFATEDCTTFQVSGHDYTFSGLQARNPPWHISAMNIGLAPGVRRPKDILARLSKSLRFERRH